MYRLAANSYSYIHSGPARRCMENLSERGFRSFELMIYPGHFWPDELKASDRREFAAWMRTSGISVASLNPPSLDINLASVTPEMQTLSQNIYAKTIELASDIGCEIVVVTPGKASPLFPAPQHQMLGNLFRGFDHLLPRAQRLGVKCALENVPIGILPAISDVLAALDEYGNADIGVVYDVANSTFIGEHAPAALRQVGPRLAAVHLSDTGTDKWKHAEVGSGVVPFAEVATVLAETNYRGPSVLEIATARGEPDVLESAEKLTKLGF